MSGIVVTLVAPVTGQLSASLIDSAANMAQTTAGVGVQVDALSESEAVDILLPEAPALPALLQRLRQQFQNLSNLDVFVQPNGNSRRKRLLVADMDATIVVGETLDELAAHLGLGDQVAPITARAMRGELDFAEALHARVALLKGAPTKALEDVRAGVTDSPGAALLVRTMAAHGARCILASGGFDYFTADVASRLGFHLNFGNRLVIGADMRLTGEVLPPILGKDRKKEILHEQCKALGVSPLDAITVGDGANDLPMLQAAGVGVAYHAKPSVLAGTEFHVRHGNLSALLFLQGYRRREWANTPGVG